MLRLAEYDEEGVEYNRVICHLDRDIVPKRPP